ncbi:MAG TPA: hypothetical protein VJQ82_10475 [Terriglobales bacterium]|nr:hypothetical protein [Terriglobales bacterium]
MGDATALAEKSGGKKMLLAMAVIAATTRKALERECAACGTKTVFPPSHRRIAVDCPGCGATIPPKQLA